MCRCWMTHKSKVKSNSRPLIDSLRFHLYHPLKKSKFFYLYTFKMMTFHHFGIDLNVGDMIIFPNELGLERLSFL